MSITKDQLSYLVINYPDHDDLVDELYEAYQQQSTIIETYRDQVDAMQLANDKRIDEMTRIYTGYILHKLGETTVDVDPAELQNKFSHNRIEQSLNPDGTINYRLLTVEG